MSSSRNDPTAAGRAYHWVRNAIANGRLVVGEQYSIYWLAEELGLSRTPAREAILRLAQLGIVEVERNRGFTVHQLSLEEVRANFEARMLLEVPAARSAARLGSEALVSNLRQLLERLDGLVREANVAAFLEWDQALHAEIVRAGGNARVEQLANALRDSSVQTWNAYTNGTLKGMVETEEQHHAIVAAIAAGDAELAGERMQSHLQRTARQLMQHTAKTLGEPVPDDFFGALVDVGTHTGSGG